MGALFVGYALVKCAVLAAYRFGRAMRDSYLRGEWTWGRGPR